jgi:hypothetical protein
MKKTVLQEVFSLIEEMHPELFDIYTQSGKAFINRFHNFLELEKSQMKEAYQIGKIQDKGRNADNPYFFEEWYNHKFK